MPYLFIAIKFPIRSPLNGEILMKKLHLFLFITTLSFACGLPASVYAAGTAFGAPGMDGVWNRASKTGIGTSYEKYATAPDGTMSYRDDGPSGPISKIWFSVADGIITETAYGLIHENQIKDVQFLIVGPGFFHEEKKDTNHSIDYLHKIAGRPMSLAYKIVNTDKNPSPKYEIEKHIFTDPDRQTLFMRVIFRSFANNVTPYILVNPYIDGTDKEDVAYAGSDSDGHFLNARNAADNKYLSVRLKLPILFVKKSAGYVGASDGFQDLDDVASGNGDVPNQMDWEFDHTDGSNPGNVAMVGQLPTLGNGDVVTFDFAIGFAENHDDALMRARDTLNDGYNTILDKYNGSGSHIGWEDYMSTTLSIPSSLLSSTGDNGHLLHTSAMVLKALEDKTFAGSLIASLSTPWGDSVSANEVDVGYRAVWPRDFYQAAMAMLALGDKETPKVAFQALDRFQVKANLIDKDNARIESDRTGWFFQSTRVDGTLKFLQVQMDQVAMPIMLGWQLWQHGVLSDAEIVNWYWKMIKPAAEFLSNDSHIRIKFQSGGTDEYTVEPAWSRQERWEQKKGYAPPNVAAIVTGLIAAADIARHVGGSQIGAAEHYERHADSIVSQIKSLMFTTTGSVPNGKFYMRVSGSSGNSNDKNADPNDDEKIQIANGGPEVLEKEVLDGGFLEFVRYGVRPADDPNVKELVPELDDETLSDPQRLKYACPNPNFVGWRRHSYDHYGERRHDGSNFIVDPGHPDADKQRGRLWPFLTGERGHYELAVGAADGILTSTERSLITEFIKSMEHFANAGLMLPEQVWDGVGANPNNYAVCEGTNSGTPLAWSHAEYVKLVKSLSDPTHKVWDVNSKVADRYDDPEVEVTFTCNNGQTVPGENVYVVGSDSRMGQWRPDSSLKLEPTAFPTWSKTFSLPASKAMEWKCIVRKLDDSIQWEPGNNNVLNTPATGTTNVDGSL